MKMKKRIALLLVMILSLGLAGGALAGETFTTKYFTIDLPEGWIVETEDLEPSGAENVEFLGYSGGPEEISLTIAAYLIYYEELKDLALWNASEEDLQNYAEAIMDEYADENPVLLGTVTAGKVPFVLLRCTDEEGDYVYADTMTNGYSIQLAAYLADEENIYSITEEAIAQFTEILSTFKPVT